MANPIVEFVWWAASPAYIANPSLLQPVIDIIKNSNGNLGVFSGLVEEANSTLYMAIVWQTFEHHQRLMDDKDTYGKLFEALGPVSLHAGADVKMHHVDFGPVNYTPTFTSGTVEYTTVTLKEGKTRAEVESIVAQLNELFKGEDTITYPGLIGWVREDPQTCILTLGWTDSKAHAAAAGQAKYAPTLTALWEVVDFRSMVHIKFAESNERSRRLAL